MAVLNHCDPYAGEWPKLNGEDQVEAGNPDTQLTVVDLDGEPAWRWWVDPDDQYGDSTGVRCLGRVWFECPDGATQAFATRILLPAGTDLDSWTLFFEGHGDAYVVAPLRVIFYPPSKLNVAYNAGAINDQGGANRWEETTVVADFPRGVMVEVAGEIRWSAGDSGYFRLLVDGEVVHDEDGPTTHSKNGVYVDPYCLTGVYMSDDNAHPVELLMRDFVWAESLAEARAALNPEPGGVEPPDPEPEPPDTDGDLQDQLDQVTAERDAAYAQLDQVAGILEQDPAVSAYRVASQPAGAPVTDARQLRLPEKGDRRSRQLHRAAVKAGRIPPALGDDTRQDGLTEAEWEARRERERPR